MTAKRLIALTTLIFTGLFVFLKYKAHERANAPFLALISDTTIMISEPNPFKIFGIEIPGLSFSKISEHPVKEGKNVYLENVCVNGKDPKTMGTQEQLLEFVQGPCLPVVLVPGLLATKLTVNIDCETLQAENPDIFSSCGWNSCSRGFFKTVPHPSYTLWIADLLGPMSLITSKTVACWGNLIQMNYNVSEPDLTKKYSSPKGAQVFLFSQTSPANEECGLAAEEDLIISPVQISYTKGYGPLKEALVAMGYQIGLTLYGAPYDWRRTTVANGVALGLAETVKQIYNLTGKPSVIAAHSLGNFGTLYLLNSLTSAEKQLYVSNYVSLMNPLAGAPKAILSFVGGDTEYIYRKYGINFAAQKKLMSASSGGTDLIPKDTFTIFENDQWLKDWQQRVQDEDEYNVETPDGKAAWESIVQSGNYTYKWFPTPLTQCFQGFRDRPDECGLFMYDWSQEPIATIMNDNFTGKAEDIVRLFDTYVTITNLTTELMADSETNNIYQLTNPEVPVTLIYGSFLMTYKSFTWNSDPNNFTAEGKFAIPDNTEFTAGDGTVPTASSLLPAFKWSWEFDNKEAAALPNAKPVKTVELCSINNIRDTIYDSIDPNSPSTVLYNEYIGVQCDCTPANGSVTTGDDCAHADVISDSKVIQFVQNIVNANYNVSDYTNTGAYVLNDTQLDDLTTTCPTIAVGTYTYSKLMAEALRPKEEEIIYA